MKRWILIVCLLVPGLALADPLSPKPGYCITQNITSTTTDDFYVASGGRLLDVTLEQDSGGTGVAISAVLYMCSGTTSVTNECKLITTSEFNGTLDGDPLNVQSIAVGKYLRVDLTGTIGTEDPIVTVCAR